MGAEPKAAAGLLLSDDLIFTSRVVGTARDLGRTIRAARSAAELEAFAVQEPPACVIVDLANPGLVIGDLVCRLRGACPRMPRVVAYGPHVEAAALRAAREAGCDPVLPRSQFVEQLPHALPAWLAR
jgi:CheY-like chemotaxis protein